MREVLLMRFGEVHLKGLNRPFFLRKLTDNVRRAIGPLAGQVWLSDSRIYISDFSDLEKVTERARKVFGVHSVSPAAEVEKDFEKISEQCLRMTVNLTGTFKVQARRSDKKFPMDSMDLGRELGKLILDNNPNLRVDVLSPEHEVFVEIREHAYVYAQSVPAAGGLPMGTGGRAALLLSGGIDSPVAGYQLMRRGVQVDAVHFFSFPYTSERAKEKVLDLARMLGEYQGGMKVSVVPFTEIQMQIQQHCPDVLGTVITRRFMMKIADRIAQKDGAGALITGENLGQVASQTMQALQCTDAVVSRPVFRPLIGLDKQEITDTAIRIGTYQTSILPYEDCCTVFTPRHPATKPKLAQCEEAEAGLDVEGLIEKAIQGVEVVIV